MLYLFSNTHDHRLSTMERQQNTNHISIILDNLDLKNMESIKRSGKSNTKSKNYHANTSKTNVDLYSDRERIVTV